VAESYSQLLYSSMLLTSNSLTYELLRGSGDRFSRILWCKLCFGRDVWQIIRQIIINKSERLRLGICASIVAAVRVARTAVCWPSWKQQTPRQLQTKLTSICDNRRFTYSADSLILMIDWLIYVRVSTMTAIWMNRPTDAGSQRSVFPDGHPSPSMPTITGLEVRPT